MGRPRKLIEVQPVLTPPASVVDAPVVLSATRGVRAVAGEYLLYSHPDQAGAWLRGDVAAEIDARVAAKIAARQPKTT